MLIEIWNKPSKFVGKTIVFHHVEHVGGSSLRVSTFPKALQCKFEC
jgi:hypothetical protein